MFQKAQNEIFLKFHCLWFFFSFNIYLVKGKNLAHGNWSKEVIKLGEINWDFNVRLSEHNTDKRYTLNVVKCSLLLSQILYTVHFYVSKLVA